VVRGSRFYSIFWVWSSSGGIVKVVRAWRRADQEGKTPPRALECIIDSEIRVRMALVRGRGAADVDLSPLRQRQTNIDLIKAARAMMFAWRLDDDATGGDAPKSLLKPCNMFEHAVAEQLARVHSLEIDMHGDFHIQTPMTATAGGPTDAGERLPVNETFQRRDLYDA
jgi:hypothetical protein